LIRGVAKILAWLILLPLTLLFVAFAVANRHGVTVFFDPLPLQQHPPLYLVAFAAMFFGLAAGGLIAWLRGGRTRRRLREEQRRIRQLEAELQAARGPAAAPRPGATTDPTRLVEAA
jgi:uncharacterized integral membrane protein